MHFCSFCLTELHFGGSSVKGIRISSAANLVQYLGNGSPSNVAWSFVPQNPISACASLFSNKLDSKETTEPLLSLSCLPRCLALPFLLFNPPQRKRTNKVDRQPETTQEEEPRIGRQVGEGQMGTSHVRALGRAISLTLSHICYVMEIIICG